MGYLPQDECYEDSYKHHQLFSYIHHFGESYIFLVLVGL